MSNKLSKINITNLFLAEDDPEDIEFFTDIVLSISPGSSISTAQNGVLFMDLLKNATELPDIIFLDLNMPFKNGFDCLREIKDSDKWKAIKTVILSTSDQPEQIRKVYELGADLYMVKPNSYSALKNFLIKCLHMEWDSFETRNNHIKSIA